MEDEATGLPACGRPARPSVPDRSPCQGDLLIIYPADYDMLCLQLACRNCSERRKALHHQDVVITTGEGKYCPVPTKTVRQIRPCREVLQPEGASSVG